MEGAPGLRAAGGGVLQGSLLLAIVIAALVAIHFGSRRDFGPTAYWTGALVSLFLAGTFGFLTDSHPSLYPLRHGFGTAYPALLLAGAIAYAERGSPTWIVALGLAIGGLRGILVLAGMPEVGRWLTLAVEPALVLCAAVIVFRSAREHGPSLRQQLLVPGLLVIAALEGATALFAPLGQTLPGPYLALWAFGVPLVFAVQISATAERVQGALRRAHDQLEQRVAERTAALAESIAELRSEVAERRAAEEALRESEERYRTVSELSSDYSFSFRMGPDQSLEIEWITDAIVRVTGYTGDELQGDAWRQLMHPDQARSSLAAVGDVLTGEKEGLLIPIRSKSGEARWVDIRFGPRRVEADGFVHMVGSGRDVTERVLAERERRRLEHHMHEAQRLESLGVLAGGIAHDFNNALTVILGNVRMALDALPEGDPLRGRMARIVTAAEYGAGLTDQMLTLSGKAGVALRPLDLSRLVLDTLDLLRASVREKSDLDIDLAGELPAVEADPTQMRQVLLNLVQNASDAFDEEGGRIRVRTAVVEVGPRELSDAFGATDSPPGEYALLEVRDDGPGIDPELQARAFEPFFTTKRSGRGLGLASVLGIVTAHGGVIDIASQPGAGTIFRVLLPLARQNEVAAAPAETRGEPSTERHTVLVVDDDDAVLEVASAFLERSGFDVLTEPGGAEAIARVRAEGSRIDAVVLDLAMPEMSGEDVFLELRRIRPDLPVVLSSGFDGSHAVERFAGEGIAGIVYKPYEPEELAAGVRNAI